MSLLLHASSCTPPPRDAAALVLKRANDSRDLESRARPGACELDVWSANKKLRVGPDNFRFAPAILPESPSAQHLSPRVHILSENAHSIRSAAIGSTRVALIAGIQMEKRATTLSASGVAINDTGSRGFTPKRKPA